jgi:hypothetical protein
MHIHLEKPVGERWWLVKLSCIKIDDLILLLMMRIFPLGLGSPCVIKLEMKIINRNIVETHTDCFGVFKSLTFVG